ncbi:FxsA family protein [Paracoccus pacificus]|uniref:FxsA family protein n=1 Tax=Paracoccus pacificus TaxID=1463598 RepID=A0ABW4R858_9RHOB
MWLIILFIVIPIIEISLFIVVGQAIGVGPTILLVLLSAVVGTWLMRRQGLRALMDLQQSFREMRDPSAPLAHGAMILFAGALLLTPGFFTDFLGLLLLVPGVRDWMMRQVRERMVVTRQGFGFDSAPDAGPDWSNMYDRDAPARQWPPRNPAGTIDGEYVIEDEAPIHPDDQPANRPTRRGKSGWTLQ